MSEPGPNSTELKKAKRDVRRAVLAARDAIAPADHDRSAAAATARFLSLPEVETASCVMVFWSFGSELPTRPMIESLHARGVVIALPTIEEGTLQPRRYEPGDPTTETAFGALEPAGGAPIEPADLDVIATPAVAFDRAGSRVGYGGGFYDRFFARIPTDRVRAGIAFDVQVLPAGAALPRGRFDLQVDLIVTETETIRCPPRT